MIRTAAVMTAYYVAIVIVLVIWFLINNHRRIWRRKNTRDRRYKTIRNNRKWNRRGGRK